MNKSKKILSLYMGALLTMISAISAAIYGSILKQITTDLRFSTLLAIKNILQVLLSFIFIIVTKKCFFPTERSEMKMLALRSTTSSLVAVTAAISYSYIPMFDAFSLYYSGCLIFGVIITIFYFKEGIGFFKIFIIFFLLLGIIFVSQPSFLFGGGAKINSDHTIGIVAVVICGVSQSVCAMSVKMMKETYTHLITLYSGVCGMILATTCYPIKNAENVVPKYNQIIFIWVLVAIYILYLLAEINALKMIQFIKYQIFVLIDLPVTFLIDYFWFHTELNFFRWIGFICIVVALLANAVYEFCTQPSEVHEEIAGNTDAGSSLLTN